jgi:EAL domain-containing protein (putative c-di-GMP-specific phosphodiesterase class I)
VRSGPGPYGQVVPRDRGVVDSAAIADVTATRGPVRLYSPRPHVQSRLLSALGADRLGAAIQADQLPAVLAEALSSLSPAEADEVMVVHDAEGPVWIESAATARQRLQTPWLPELLAERRVSTWFQPLVVVASSQVAGREAMMRAVVGGRLLRGSELISAARAHGLLYALDQQARIDAIRRAAPILPAGEVLCVNLLPSAVDDAERCLAPTWAAAAEAGVATDQLCLELVQTDTTTDRALLLRIRELAAAQGALVALDDLGAGWASMQSLRELRPDLVKLDREMLLGLSLDASRQRMVSALIDFAHELGVNVVAHGVEDADDLASVVSLGADSVQGYLIGEPAEWMDGLSMSALALLEDLRRR